MHTPFKRWRIARVGDTTLNVTLKLAGFVTIVYVFGVRVSFIGELFPIPLYILPLLAVALLAGMTVIVARHTRNPDLAVKKQFVQKVETKS